MPSFFYSAADRLPKPLAALFARASSGYVSALLRAIGAIPVYRGSVKIKETFLATVAALRSGGSVLIFPRVFLALLLLLGSGPHIAPRKIPTPG